MTIVNREALLSNCKELSEKSSILDQIATEIADQGFAGNAEIPKLLYLTLLTGMLKKPVSVLIKGPSGAGKSFSLGMGKQFIPKRAYEEFAGMSEKAIVYLKEISFKNKHLIISEASGMAEGPGRGLLRQLLSEGKIRYATVESTDKGLKGTELPTIEGPCGLIMTTTATGIHPEDESRMLSINMQESSQQIADALMAIATGANERRGPVNFDPWFALYDYIDSGPKEAAIPYASRIAERLPRTHDKIKRDFPQVLSLIEAHALLHSCTRDQDDQGRVVATLADYNVVRRLVNEAISEGLSKTVPNHVRQLIQKVKEATTRSGDVSQTKLAELLDRDASVVSRTVTKAIADGYLENTNPGQGREAKLIIGGRKLPSESVLPILTESRPAFNNEPIDF